MLSRKVRRLLRTVGYEVHCEPMASRLKERGLAELPPGRQNVFIDPCNCINPILRLEERIAEVLGGVIMSYPLNPEVDHIGCIPSGAMDFRTVRTTQSSPETVQPETVQIDCGAVELMEHAFGGNTFIGGRSYVSSAHPGMQAVFEKMFKASAC